MTRFFWTIALVLLWCAPAAAQNQPCPVPWIFTNGSGGTFQPDANQVNQNFAAIEACLLPATTTSLGIVQPDGVTITVNGQGVISAGLVGDSVLNNSDLMLAKTTSFPNGVFRIAYSGAPLAPTSTPLFYLPSTSPCVLGAGAGDGGSQVKSGDNLCWIAQIPSTGADIKWWGLPSNPINFYATTTGNDYGAPGAGVNYCVVVAIPCATPIQASAAANKFCVNGGNAWLNLGAGSWAYTIQQNGPLKCAGNSGVGLEQGEIVVNGTGASSTTLTGAPGQNRATDAKSFGMLAVQNLTITSATVDIWTEIGGDTDIYTGVVLGAAGSQLIHTEDPGSQTNLWDSITVSGGSHIAWLADTNSSVEFNPVGGSPTVTFVGSPAFSAEVADAAYNSTIYIGADWVFTGTVTGPQFLDLDNGVIQYNGSTLAGNSGGLIDGQGVLDPSIPPLSYTVTVGSLGTGGHISSTLNSDVSGYVNVVTGNSGTTGTVEIEVQFADFIAGRICSWQPSSGYILPGFFANSTGFTDSTSTVVIFSSSPLPLNTSFFFQYQCTGRS
jgi:hypothetical protein